MYVMSDAEYHRYELAKLGDVSEGGKVKLRGDNGETRWMTISAETLADIADALTKEREV